MFQSLCARFFGVYQAGAEYASSRISKKQPEVVTRAAIFLLDICARTDKTEAEAKPLIEQGWQYVTTTPQDVMLFRKRK